VWRIPARLATSAVALVRRPSVLLASVVLLGLFALGAAIAGRQVLAWHYYRAGRAALDHYHPLEASEHLEKCLAIWPNDPDALVLAARAERRLDNFEAAEVLLNRAHGMKRNYDPLTERLMLRAARGEIEQISKVCQALIDQNDPDASLILEALVSGAIRSSQLRFADKCLHVWLEREPDSAMAHYYKGALFEFMAVRQEAAAAFKHALELDPQHDPARLQFAIQLLDLLRAAEAVPHLEYLQQQQPKDFRIPVYLAQCKKQMGELSEAEKILDTLLESNPNFPPALTERAKLFMDAGQLGEAEPLLRRATRYDPNDYTAHHMLLQCVWQRENRSEASELQKRLKQIEEDSARMQVLVGSDLAKNPRDPDLHYESGMIAMRAGNYREMLRWFDSALRIDPKHAPTHRAMADFLQKAGQLGEAQKHWEMAKEVDPTGTVSRPPIPVPRNN
jgi:tetratricopeptide (TPR) repeat protein